MSLSLARFLVSIENLCKCALELADCSLPIRPNRQLDGGFDFLTSIVKLEFNNTGVELHFFVIVAQTRPFKLFRDT